MHDDLGTSDGDFHFSPDMLMQVRPHAKNEDWILTNPRALEHERAHWSHFAGSTIGSLLLTLARCEDLYLGEGLQDVKHYPDAYEWVKARAAAQLPLIPVGRFGPDLHEILIAPPRAAQLVGNLLAARWVRTLILDADRQWAWDSSVREGILSNVLFQADAVYAVHTGGSRRWSSGSPVYAPSANRRSVNASSVTVGDGELTTRQLMEAGALLNEWGGLTQFAWDKEAFVGLDYEHERLLGDSIDGATERYTRALRYACVNLSKGKSEIFTLSLENKLAFFTLAISACIDIALNPPCAPICRQFDFSWSTFYPPARFLAAIAAASQLDPPGPLVGNTEYGEYRDQVAEFAKLPLGILDHRSFQLAAIGPALFSDERPDGRLLWSITYFDYLIWAMEHLHAFRMKHPLAWILPWTLNHKHYAGEASSARIDSKKTPFLYAPILALGDEKIAFSYGLSEAFGSRLYYDLLGFNTLRQVVVSGGKFSLAPLTTRKEAERPAEQEFVRAFLRKTTGSLYDAWPFEQLEPITEAADWRTLFTDDELQRAKLADNKEFVGGAITRSSCESLDYSQIDEQMSIARSDIYRYRNSLTIQFSGYDYKPNGLWDEPAVMRYLRGLQDRIRDWPWWVRLSPDPTQSYTFILIYASSFDDPRSVTLEQNQAWLRNVYSRLNEFTRVNGVGLDMNRHVSDAIGFTLRTAIAHRFA